MTFTVVYDANVLYPNTLRDLLIRIAQSGTVQAKWTNAILDEMLAALRRSRPDIPAEKLERLRDLMNKAVRDCLVTGHEPLIEGLKLPDPEDRHVLAAAIKAGAQVIVTRNLKASKTALRIPEMRKTVKVSRCPEPRGQTLASPRAGGTRCSPSARTAAVTRWSDGRPGRGRRPRCG
jgi:predicted nucleic acid-binding protein